MINRIHRFHGYNSLRLAYQRGQTSRGPLFAVKALANTRRSNYRLAVVVSRKVHKSAVIRNRIRRRLYEIVRQMNIDSAHDIVITVFHDTVATEDIKSLRSQLKKQLKQLGIAGHSKEAPATKSVV